MNVKLHYGILVSRDITINVLYIPIKCEQLPIDLDRMRTIITEN